MDDYELPGTLGDIQHYGVKGMKWGIRNEDKGAGDRGTKAAKEVANRNDRTKMYLGASKKAPVPTPDEAVSNFRVNQEKFAAKFGPSESSVKGPPGQIERSNPRLTPEQKKALMYVGGGVAVAGGLYLGSRWLGNNPDMMLKLVGIDEKAILADIAKSPKIDPAELAKYSGKPIDPQQFHGLVGYSQGQTWMGGSSYMTEQSFARPEFELPAGQIFYRLSTKAEEGFKGPTYTTHSVEDFNRYVSGFRQEKGLNAKFYGVQWQAKTPVKVPNLTTVLGEFHQVLEAEAKVPTSVYAGMKITPETVTKEYQAISGSGWTSPAAKGLVSRLKEKGFGAIVDEMDAGVIGETPLVFFDTEAAGPKRSSLLTPDRIQQAESLLTELNNPPGRKP